MQYGIFLQPLIHTITTKKRGLGGGEKDVDGCSTASVANEGSHHADWSWETVLCINDVLPLVGGVYCHAHLFQCKQQRVLLKQHVLLFHCAL